MGWAENDNSLSELAAGKYAMAGNGEKGPNTKQHSLLQVRVCREGWSKNNELGYAPRQMITTKKKTHCQAKL
jgi:hypothetical protein